MANSIFVGFGINEYLVQIGDITPSDGTIIVGDGTGWVGESGATARTSLGLGAGDSPQFTGVTFADAGPATFGTTTPPTLIRAGAYVLAQRNGTNAQTHRVYRTFDGTNDAYISIGFSGTDTLIRNVATGSATGGRLTFESMSGQPIRFVPAGTGRWDMDSNGHFVPITTNSVDIGMTGTRVRTGYFATSVVAPLYVAGSTNGVTAGPFTTITGIQTIGGIVTTLTGS